MEWKMIKPSITWDFDAFQGRTHVNLHEESKGLLPCTLSCMLPYQKETSHGHLSSATPSSSGTTAATAGASLDSGSSGIIPAINLKEICQRKEFTVGDFEGPEKQQYYSERYVDASYTAKAPPAPPPPPPPPSSAFTVLPYSERTFAQGKRIHPLDQLSSPLSKGLTIASSNDDDPVNLKIKQQRTSFAKPVMDHPVLRCQIDGCKEDLSKAKKDYHRRHKVCEMHSKAPGVIKSGLEQRFCQQCSRFHVVGEFDDTKRSCRRRLEGHNRRRRKSNKYQGNASSFSVGSIFQLGHDKLLLNHLMQHHHQPEMPLRRMQFYQNNEGMLRRAVGWPVAGFQEEQQQQQQGVAMASLPADFNEINSRLRAVLNYGQINKGSSSSLSLLGLQQHEEAFSSLGKALSLCTTTNGSTCALSLLSPHTLPEPVIHDQVTLDEKLPNRLNYSPNHHHQNLTLASVGLISSDPQSALPLANQPRSLALSMGTSDVSSGIKEEFYQKQLPLAATSPCNNDNMALFPSLAPNNPFLARLLLHEAANHHHYQQLDTAMEVNAQHLQPPQGFANNF